MMTNYSQPHAERLDDWVIEWSVIMKRYTGNRWDGGEAAVLMEDAYIFTHISKLHNHRAHMETGKHRERDGFPCISPPFPHMQSFQSNDLQWTHKETSAFKHTATTESERKRHRWHQLSRHDKDSRLVGRSWHTHLPEEDLDTIRLLQHYHKHSRHTVLQ